MSDESQNPPQRRRRRSRIGLLVLVVVGLLFIAMAGAAVVVIGGPIAAPDWLRTRIQDKVSEVLPGTEARFGEASFVFEDGWLPRLSVRDVMLVDSLGTPVLALTDVSSRVALQPLLRGEVQPAEVWLSGMRMTLERNRSGAVSMALDDGGAVSEQAASLSSLIGRIDTLLTQPQFQTLSRIEADNLTIRYEDGRAGRGWTVDGGRMLVTRDDDDLRLRGDFALLGARDYATTLEMNYTSRIGDPTAEFGVSFQDMPAEDVALQSPALAWLAALEAPISGSLRAGVDADGALGELNATLQIGAGALQPNPATRPIPFRSARTYFTYNPAAQSMRIDELVVDSEWVSARAEGHAYLVGLDTGWPTELLGQFQLSDVRANPEGVYDAPIVIEAATMDSRLRLDPFEFTLGELSLQDQGQRLVLDGVLRAEPEGWDLALNGAMDGLRPDRLLALWPEVGKGVKTRTWIAKNVTQGTLSDIQLAVRSKPETRPDIFLGFDFDDLTARFVKTMPPITKGAGHATLYKDRFVVLAEAGQVAAGQGGAIDITGTRFVVPDVRIDKAPAQIGLTLNSTITAALSLIDEAPLNIMQKAGRAVTLADGRAEVSGQLDLTLVKDLKAEDVDFDIAARLRSVRSEVLVPGRVLAAPDLQVAVSPEAIEIRGAGRIGAVPVDAVWQAALDDTAGGASRVTGTVELSERFTDEFRIGLPPGSVSGAGQGDFVIDLTRGGGAAFSLRSNLSGLGLRLPPLGWSLARKTRGTLEVAGQLGEPPSIDRIAFDAPGLRANGTVTLGASGALDRARFSTVRAGNWLNAPVELIGRGAGRVPAVRVTGGTIDMRQTTVGSGENGGTSGGGGPISLALDRLEVSEGISLTGFRAEFDTSRGFDGTFSGAVNGGAGIAGRITPQNGRSAFRLQSQNAGGVLKSAGMLKQAAGGDMDLILTPAAQQGSYDGYLKVTNTRLREAPAMAALLNAVSIVGLLEQFTGEGILFSEVEARFRLTPTMVTLLQSSAVGASMGISMDGFYGLETGNMDMQGVVSPLYLLNGVGSILTRKGEGLVGFNYTLKGPSANPRVSVNPLSIFTPGMFREIFRRPAPQVQP